MKRSIFLVIAVASISLFASADAARAQAYPNMHDYYTGVSCVADGSNQDNIQYWWGRAANPTTSTVGMNCAITRPVSCNGCSGTLRMHVVDMHYTANVFCEYRGWNPSSFHSYWYDSASSSGSSGNSQMLTMDGVSGNHRYVYCDVPGTYSGNLSFVIGYEFTQN